MQAVNLLINMIEKNFIVNKSAAIEKTTTTIIVKKTSVETGLICPYKQRNFITALARLIETIVYSYLINGIAFNDWASNFCSCSIQII